MGNHHFLTLSLLLITIFTVSADSAFRINIHGVKILRQASDAKLAQLGVFSWPTWEGAPSTFPWTFEKTETMYLVEGKVKVNVDGYDSKDETFEIGKGDLVVFPKGMKVVWEITEAVKKHYSLGE